MDLGHDILAQRIQSRISIVSLGRHRRAESIVVVNQELQTRHDDRHKSRLLKRVLLPNQHIYIIRDRHADGIDDGVEDPPRVRLVELRREIGVCETFAVGDVDCSHGAEDGCSLDQGGEEVAAFVGFCGGFVCEDTFVDVVDVLDEGVCCYDAWDESGGCGEGGGEEDGGELGEMHFCGLDCDGCVWLLGLMKW